MGGGIKPSKRTIQTFLIAENRAAECLGYAETRLYTESDTLLLDYLFVFPKNRRKGYGKRLIQTMNHYARESGCKRIQLRVDRNNRAAIAFYVKCGFSAALVEPETIVMMNTIAEKTDENQNPT